MQVDFADLQRRWHPGVKALLLTHYLGFDRLTNEITAFCRSTNTVVIEDCAHAFLSAAENGQPLGSRGDAAIFSLRKTLPCPDGGALMIAAKRREGVTVKLVAPNPWVIFFRNCELLEGNTARSSGAGDRMASTVAKCAGKMMAQAKLPFRAARRLWHVGGTCLVHPNSYAFVEAAANWRISSFTAKRLADYDWQGIAARRRQNFSYLLAAISADDRMRPAFARLPEGTCPLFFPILTKNREKMRRFLWDRRIDSHAWWGYFHPQVPWSEFPEAARLKQELLGLPVHQDLAESHMARIADTVSRARHIA